MESDDGARDGEQDGGDVDREAILARRRRLVATAVAGLAMTACDRSSTPVPCLTPTVIERSEDAASQVEPTPMPCLAPMPAVADDADVGDASSAASASDASVADVAAAPTPDAASARAPRVRPPRTRPGAGRVTPTVCLMMFKPSEDE